MADIDKGSLEHLAELARIKLDPSEEEVLLKDLRKILAHVAELGAVDTSDARLMTGGTHLKNIFREDGGTVPTNRGKGKDGFPDSHKGFLKVPPVFQ